MKACGTFYAKFIIIPFHIHLQGPFTPTINSLIRCGYNNENEDVCGRGGWEYIIEIGSEVPQRTLVCGPGLAGLNHVYRPNCPRK